MNDGIIAELEEIANEVDDFRCFFQENRDSGYIQITDEPERAENCVTRLDLLIDHLKGEED